MTSIFVLFPQKIQAEDQLTWRLNIDKSGHDYIDLKIGQVNESATIVAHTSIVGHELSQEFTLSVN